MENCHFENCEFYEDGKCHNDEVRELCVDMSRKILCLDEKTKNDTDYKEM